MDLVEEYLKQMCEQIILKQTGGERGPTVSVNQKALPEPTAAQLLARKRRETGFAHKPPGGGAYKKSVFQRKSPDIREELEACLNEDISGLIASVAVLNIIYKYAKDAYDKVYGEANRACANLGGSKGRLCRKNYEIQATKAQIQALKYARSQKCRKAKDPKECVQKINKRIKKLETSRPEVQFKAKA